MARQNEPKAVFFNPDHTAIPDVYPVKFRVENMEWNEIGGPVSAEISASGGRRDILNLVGLLGCGVDISCPWGFIWWGFGYSITLHLKGMDITFTMDGMHNRIAVAYTFVGPGAPQGGIRKTTSYAQDSNSVADWGTHEFLHTGNNMTDAAAIAQRTILLAAAKLPMGSASLMQMGGKISASISCKGLLDTLDWRMANVAAEASVSYTSTSTTTQNVGSGSSNAKVMQQFTVGASDIHVIQVAVYAKKVGSPDDELSVDLFALDGSGNPTGNSLASGSIPAYLLTTSLAWVTVDLAETVLTAATQYALQLSRGQEDSSNCYQVNVNTDLGYSEGVFKIFDATWNLRSPNADMPFVVYIDPQVENTQQVINLISTYGQFLAGVIVEDVSDSITGSYRDGDTTVLSEIRELLKVGGPDDRRYRAMVSRERYLIISQRPAEGTPYYYLTETGKIMEGSMRAHPFDSMVGRWCGMVDYPYSGSATNTHAPDLQYVISSSWNRGQGIQPGFEGTPGIDELLAVYR